MSLYWHMPVDKDVNLIHPESISRELNQNKKQIKKKKLPRTRNEPPRLKRLKQSLNYKNSRAKDVRFSDQRKIRRMYRNC